MKDMRKNGYITPERQAGFLAHHGHLEGTIFSKDNNRNFEQLFTFRGQGFRVIYVGGQVAQIIKMSEDAVKTMVACSKLKFGGF